MGGFENLMCLEAYISHQYQPNELIVPAVEASSPQPDFMMENIAEAVCFFSVFC